MKNPADIEVDVKALTGSLKTPGILLLCYFIVPPLLNFALGRHDALFGRALISDLVQAAFGIAVLKKIYRLRAPVSGKLETWLGQFRQTPERTSELAGRIVFAAGCAAAAALLLPPVSQALPRWLAVPANLAAIGYVVYISYGVWRLYEPFAERPPDAPEPEPEPEAPRAPEARCPRCGQKLDPADEFCSFCRRPADKSGA